VSKLRGIGVTATEKLGELLLTVSIGERVHIASLATGEDAEEVSRRLHELADKIEAGP
jgi:phosphotransferase system HPr-like phosphotransfer protein